ncbi:hypothetical protein HOO54_14530 [Bacillus sp. WMMC1349]|uniref:hypothetical protein n=1 Tax=Bacillus sp. WMMC1349 TaxID=2736254 RepID=UPI001556E44E|nr:hypothetical protein [Bacillus sp. WMMC1349]NPC93419.1 hypothetical protein [Bacillus sp. WMMC1349]
MYCGNLLLPGHSFTWTKIQVFGHTKIYIPHLSTFQFTIILTIPLFLLTLIGIGRFISILETMLAKKTPFHSEVVSIFRKFSKMILYFGFLKLVISIIGGLFNLYPENLYTEEVVILFFPADYLLGSLIMMGVAYILKLGISIKSENDMFV